MDREINTENPTAGMQGYRAPHVCKLVGITYRQLDYWARTDLLQPSLRAAEGSGTQRLYSFSDLVQLRMIKGLLDAGLHLNRIRQAVDWLREQEIDQPLSEANLVSDGSTILASFDREGTQEYLMDALRRGQGVFAIAVGQIQRDLEGELLDFAPKAIQAELPLTELQSGSEAATS
ncbi:MerR family transcriptional regulator [Candidatus Spongiisocius sp.]|uniref:MerR family transcriptional regulator n=1 Tax=Candidatus Spongiisocius sp. TaxID=3101273 RepID=UPI003B5A706E